MPKRWSEWMVVRDLVPADRNAKGHADDLIDQSLNRFGIIEAIALDERTGKIISGHGRRERIMEAEDAGADPPEGVEVDDQGRWTVLVLRGWASQNDDEAEAAGIALNRIGEVGGWRIDVLADSLDTISATPLGFEGLGYGATDLEDYRARLTGPSTLDELAAQFGEPQASDMWPVLRWKVSPELKARYAALVAGVQGDDSTVFAHLLGLAERGAAVVDEPV